MPRRTLPRPAASRPPCAPLRLRPRPLTGPGPATTGREPSRPSPVHHREARLGNPHGVLTVDADGEMWTVEVGQPWRNARAGLQDGDLAPGVEVAIEGEPAADVSERRLKAERLTIAGRDYDLYPDRS